MDAEKRIEELEQQVEALQDRVPDGVNRREFGKTAGAFGLGALLGGGGAATTLDSASADASTSDSDDDIETPSDRVDVFADSIDAKSLEVDEGRIGTDPQRPLVSTTYETITVGTDVGTIQEAFDQIPTINGHGIVIDIPDGDYTNEDPVIWGASGGSLRDGSETVAVLVDGNTTTPSNVLIHSISLSDVPCWVNFRGFRLTGDSPYETESTHLQAYNCAHVSIRDMEIRNGTNGVMSYNSNIEIAGVDIGSSSISGTAVQAKHGGIVWESGAVSDPLSGKAGEYAYAPQFGEIYCRTNTSTISGGNGYLVNGNEAGIVYDLSSRCVIGGGPDPRGTGRNSFKFQMTTESGSNVSVSAGGTQTIFDTSSSGNCAIFGGSITGYDPSNITVTWEDGSTQTLEAGGAGKDSAGNVQSTVPVPTLGPVQKLTFDNGDGLNVREYGWTVYRTQI